MKREIHENVRDGVRPFMPDLEGFFDRLEKQFEKELITLFYQVGIHAKVKTDKYSLPHQGEVVIKLMRESYINAMYEQSRIFRPILKEMLDKNAGKIRFYLHIETYDDKRTGFLGAITGTGFKYSFRYYLH